MAELKVKITLSAKEQMLIGMNEIVLHLNNEDAIEPWLTYGVPDGASLKDIKDMAADTDTFAECASLFMRIMSMKEAYADGMVVDDTVITAYE